MLQGDTIIIINPMYRCMERLSDLPNDHQLGWHLHCAILPLCAVLSCASKSQNCNKSFSYYGVSNWFSPGSRVFFKLFSGRSIIRASPHLKVQIGQYQPCCLKSYISWKSPKAQTTIPLTHRLIRSSSKQSFDPCYNVKARGGVCFMLLSVCRESCIAIFLNTV